MSEFTSSHERNSFKNLNGWSLLSLQFVTRDKKPGWVVVRPPWVHFNTLPPEESTTIHTGSTTDLWATLFVPSPAATKGDRLPSLHLGWSSTYSTISAAISANGCVALFQIDQLQCTGRGPDHLLNQLRAITFSKGVSSEDLPGDWVGTDGSLRESQMSAPSNLIPRACWNTRVWRSTVFGHELWIGTV